MSDGLETRRPLFRVVSPSAIPSARARRASKVDAECFISLERTGFCRASSVGFRSGGAASDARRKGEEWSRDDEASLQRSPARSPPRFFLRRPPSPEGSRAREDDPFLPLRRLFSGAFAPRWVLPRRGMVEAISLLASERKKWRWRGTGGVRRAPRRVGGRTDSSRARRSLGRAQSISDAPHPSRSPAGRASRRPAARPPFAKVPPPRAGEKKSAEGPTQPSRRRHAPARSAIRVINASGYFP